MAVSPGDVILSLGVQDLDTWWAPKNIVLSPFAISETVRCNMCIKELYAEEIPKSADQFKRC